MYNTNITKYVDIDTFEMMESDNDNIKSGKNLRNYCILIIIHLKCIILVHYNKIMV